MAWQVKWTVLVDGQDLTPAMQPFLIDISVQDKAGAASDSCSLTFDDTDAQLRFPKDGSLVSVFLQGIPVFTGTVDSIRSSGSRGGGRTIKVGAKGFDSRGKAKENQSFHKDNASLEDFMKEAAQKSGFEITVDPDLASIQRDYWSADGESFIHIGERMARELSATFKLRDKKATLVPHGKDLGLPVITGTVGKTNQGNVISWNIAPLTGRRTFTKTKVSYFDRQAASIKTEEAESPSMREAPESINAVRAMTGDKAQAMAIGQARGKESERESGEGSVELDLDPYAQAEALFLLKGARPGVDGLYRIEGVTHKASRSGGTTTGLSLKQPHGDAGKDSR